MGDLSKKLYLHAERVQRRKTIKAKDKTEYYGKYRQIRKSGLAALMAT